MFFEGPKLKHAFSGGGGKPPQPEEPAGLFDKFKAAAVSFQGPVVCQKLKIAVDDLMARHTLSNGPKASVTRSSKAAPKAMPR